LILFRNRRRSSRETLACAAAAIGELELEAPHRVVDPLFPLDVFTAPKVRIEVGTLDDSFSPSLFLCSAQERSSSPPLCHAPSRALLSPFLARADALDRLPASRACF